MASSARVFGFVISAHGYGHATREMEVIRALLARDPACEVVVLTAAPEAVFYNYLGPEPRLTVVAHRADVGLVQVDSLTIDREATLAALDARFGDPARAERDLADLLAPFAPTVIVADIPPVAFGAAALLAVPSVGVSNFDWAWIYGHYARDDARFARWEALYRRWQGQATLGVQLLPGPPLVGFREVIEVEPFARAHLDDPDGVRRALAIPAGHKAVLVSFGGCGLDDANARIPEVPGVTWILAPPMPDLGRADTRFAPDAPYTTLFAVADAAFMKPGYGSVCEAALHHTRVLYTDRGDFPEYDWLVRWLEAEVPSVHVPSALLGTERGAHAITSALARLFALEERWPARMNGAAQVAAILERLAAR